MKILMMLISAVLLFVAAGCAGSGPKEPEQHADGQPKILVTDRAYAYIDNHGMGIAAMKGATKDSDLVCEVVQLPNRDIRTFCYMRDEMEKRDLNHQEEWRRLTMPGARATN